MTAIDVFGNREKNLKMALKINNRSLDDLKQCTEIIRDWIKTQPHLPEMPAEELIVSFLISCKFSIEKVKKKLDMYYSIRSIVPEFYNKNPKDPGMRHAFQKQHYYKLPGLTPAGYRVILIKVVATPEELNLAELISMRYNILDILYFNDCAAGDVIVEDLSDIQMGHVLKVTPTFLKRAFLPYVESCPSRFIGYHFINAPPYCDTILNVIKQILKPKLAARVHVNKDFNEIKDIIPSEMLPIEYGGKNYDLKQLKAAWTILLEKHQWRFDQLEKLRTDESKRPTPLVNDEILGYHGNFRKLEVD